MSLIEVARRAGPPSSDFRATQEFSDIVIGPDILELLSSAMYVDPITIYREYVQNAADAIDVARNEGLLVPDQPGRVNIVMDAQARSVRIRDNGCGIPSDVYTENQAAAAVDIARQVVAAVRAELRFTPVQEGDEGAEE